MENGFASYNSTLEDNDRVDYYKQHLEQVHIRMSYFMLNEKEDSEVSSLAQRYSILLKTLSRKLIIHWFIFSLS